MNPKPDSRQGRNDEAGDLHLAVAAGAAGGGSGFALSMRSLLGQQLRLVLLSRERVTSRASLVGACPAQRVERVL
jgi:hypothetical protein